MPRKYSDEELVERMRRAREASKEEPDITDSLPEYIPVPEAEDEVVAVVIKRRPSGAKKRALSKKVPVAKKTKPTSASKHPKRR